MLQCGATTRLHWGMVLVVVSQYGKLSEMPFKISGIMPLVMVSYFCAYPLLNVIDFLFRYYTIILLLLWSSSVASSVCKLLLGGCLVNSIASVASLLYYYTLGCSSIMIMVIMGPFKWGAIYGNKIAPIVGSSRRTDGRGRIGWKLKSLNGNYFALSLRRGNDTCSDNHCCHSKASCNSGFRRKENLICDNVTVPVVNEK